MKDTSLQIIEYFRRTARYYLGNSWPTIHTSIYKDTRFDGWIFEIRLMGQIAGLQSREVINVERITMEEFDHILKKMYEDFYYKTRVALVCKSFSDNVLKPLTPNVEYGII